MGAARLGLRARQGACRIIVGSSGTRPQRGWIPTEVEFLDVRRADHWERYFEPGSVRAILAEHVWEHLTAEEAVVAAANCFAYLEGGGYLRVAVPDGLHPDPDYIDRVRPGGTGPGADDHKILYDYRTFGWVFESVGFRVLLLEYFDEEGHFHGVEWDPEAGKIRRSRRYDPRNDHHNLAYTSIVLDAIKER